MTPLTLRADRSGERADQFLARMLPQLSRSAAQKLLEDGGVPATVRRTLGGDIDASCGQRRRKYTKQNT